MPNGDPDCGQIVEGTSVSFACDLPRAHEGPHRAKENPRSVRERETWEHERKKVQAAAQGTQEVEAPEVPQTLDQYQERPQTTAERYTVNPTAVPGADQEPQPAATPQPEVVEIQGRAMVLEYDSSTGESVQRLATREEAVDAGLSHLTTRDTPAFVPPGDHFLPPEQEEAPRRMSREEYEATQQDLPQPEQTYQAESAPEPVGEMRASGGHGGGDHTTAPERGNRPGEQGLPEAREGESVQERIIKKMEALHGQGGMPDHEYEFLQRALRQSMELGVQRYGTPLQTFNGRDTLQDAMDEARDLLVYLNSLDQARDAEREELVEAVSRAIVRANQERQESGQEAFGVRQLAEVAVDAILDATGPIPVGD